MRRDLDISSFGGTDPLIHVSREGYDCIIMIATIPLIHASRTESDSDTLVVWKTEPGFVLSAVFAMRTRGMRLSRTVYIAGRTAFNPRIPRRMRRIDREFFRANFCFNPRVPRRMRQLMNSAKESYVATLIHASPAGCDENQVQYYTNIDPLIHASPAGCDAVARRS